MAKNLMGNCWWKNPGCFGGFLSQRGEGRIVSAQMSSSLELLKYQTAPKPRFWAPRWFGLGLGQKSQFLKALRYHFPNLFWVAITKNSYIGKWREMAKTCQHLSIQFPTCMSCIIQKTPVWSLKACLSWYPKPLWQNMYDKWKSVDLCHVESMPKLKHCPIFYECQEKLVGLKGQSVIFPQGFPDFWGAFPNHGLSTYISYFCIVKKLWTLNTSTVFESSKGQREQAIFSQWDSSPSNIPKSKEDIEWNESSNQTEMERYGTPWAHLQSQNSPPWEFQTLWGLKPGNDEKMQLAGMVAGQEKEHWDWTNSFLLSVQDMVLDCWGFLSTVGWCL